MLNRHIGSSFDEFLKEEGIYHECNQNAQATLMAWLRERNKQLELAIADAIDVIEYGALCIDGSAYSETMKEVAHNLRNSIFDKSWNEILDENNTLKQENAHLKEQLLQR